jgi:hypothetical protein
MKNNLNTSIFKRLWSYVSKKRYEKNLKYAEYKKQTPIWRYRFIKITSLVLFYYLGNYFIKREKITNEDIKILDIIHENIIKHMEKKTNFKDFFHNLQNEVSNFYNLYLINNSDIEEIVNNLDQSVLPKLKIMKVEKIISEEEIKDEPKEIIDKIEY